MPSASCRRAQRFVHWKDRGAESDTDANRHALIMRRDRRRRLPRRSDSAHDETVESLPGETSKEQDLVAEPGGYAVGWGTLALINAGLAQGKNRSGLAWFLVSLLLGPLATFILLLMEKLPSKR